MSNEPSESKPLSTDGDTAPSIDATIGFEPGVYEPSARGEGALTKQDRDLAFAAMLLRSGTMNEQQLSQAVENWTTYGFDTLADHLIREELITSQQGEELQAKALNELDRVVVELSTQPELSRPQQARLRLDRLDGNGRLAKLLGVADSATLSADEMECRTIGARYTLLRRLGQGGLGTVWLARDENLNRYVAVKEITRQAKADDPALAHFRREAEITGMLEHPGIVPVYQFGTDEKTGRSFYAMRFLGKRTLQDVITEYHERREAGDENRKLIRHRLLTAFVNVCHAVAHAHSRKVIHRDLKPDNIAIDSFGQVVLLDWGLSKINEASGMYEANGKAEPGDLHSIGSTQSGRVLGTPLYMAPEQAAGRLDQVDELTDIFGLGGILYAILTGSAPHARQIEYAGTNSKASQIFSTIVSRQIIPPQQLVEEIPPELNAVCVKALAQKRYLRYATATELADDVERYRAGSPVTAYEAPVRQQISRWMSAHPTLTQLLLLMTALTILGGAVIGFTARRGRNALVAARYDSLRDFTGELEMSLQFEVEELIQDARFITDFPLTLAVTASQDPASLPENETKLANSTVDIASATPEEWLERQGRMFDGILNANPDYLVISNVQFSEVEMMELVRSERLKAGMHPRRVPRGQLYSGGYPESSNELPELRSGQVVLTTGDQMEEALPCENRSPLVVVALCPIFDTTGKFFGFNVIELDVQERLEELLLSTGHDNVNIYVTDRTGKVALSFHDGRVDRRQIGYDLTTSFPAVQSIFGKENESSEYGNSRSLVARRVLLGGDDTHAHIGIIATTKEEILKP